jgi:hypothetical protein
MAVLLDVNDGGPTAEINALDDLAGRGERVQPF